MPVSVRAPGKQPPLELIPSIDFTGGLNLVDDRFKLEANESPDMRNVDVDKRGGISLRKAVASYGNAPGWGGAVTGLAVHDDTPGLSPYLLVTSGTTLWHGQGGAWTPITIATTAVAFEDHAQLNDVTYGCAGSTTTPTPGVDESDGSTHTWAGGAGSTTRLTDVSPTGGPTAFQNTYASPSGSHAPRCRHLEAHVGHLWAGYTREDGTDHPNRVRFSHPNDGGSWAEDDWIDINPGDGDAIIQMIAFRDHLVVFKANSIWAVFGYSRETFQVVEISNNLGLAAHRAVVQSPLGLWFFDGGLGLHLYNGSGSPQWVFEKVWPAMRDADIDLDRLDETAVGWVEGRVWVSLRIPAGADRDFITFVFDPTLGAWMDYEICELSNFVTYTSTDGVERYLAAIVTTDYIIQLEENTSAEDNLDGSAGGGPNNNNLWNIDSHYVTPWLSGGNPFQPKRWKRPEFIVRGGSASNITVVAYADYDDTAEQTSFTLATTAQAAGGIWGTGVWGTMLWGGSPGTFNEIIRGGAISGGKRALSMKFIGPMDGDNVTISWGVEAFTLKYRPKRIRS